MFSSGEEWWKSSGNLGTPFPRGCRKLKGEVDAYRLRVGKIRVLYKILWDEKVIVVFKIEHRERAYQ